jgi:hypothetical protein
LVVLHKDSDGVVTALELEGLEPDETALFDDLHGDVLGLLNGDDITLRGQGARTRQQRCRPGLGGHMGDRLRSGREASRRLGGG